ncbi:MAG: acylase [Gammaproteobacteria bacterium]|nr:acylase [Gammaproteobacteria bacterium]
MKRAAIGIGGASLLLLVVAVVWSRPVRLPTFDGAAYRDLGGRYDVRILRDDFGVPHIYGRRDEDVAFGLAYAHAEDDFATLQQSLMTSRGRAARIDPQAPRLVDAAAAALGLPRPFAVEGPDPAVSDYLVALLRVRERVREGLPRAIAEGRISRKTLAVLQGYADGVNLYAAEYPDAVVHGFEPVTAEDLVAGFTFFTPLFFGLERDIRALFGPGPPAESVPQGGGSNAMAVAPVRTPDGATRLLINSHQPYTGPLAWYEVRLKSAEGWDMAGGVFPGSPFILHGFGPALGWANTVNTPDLSDTYRLVIDPADPDRYRFDGAWRRLERREAELELRLFGPLAIRVRREALWSVHGPVLRRPHGSYALRYANMDRVDAVQGYYQLNRAKDWADFQAALRLQAIPSQNYVYADATGRIAYVYNAAFPRRDPSFDWRGVLPGDTSRALWQGYEPFDKVPKVVAPASGYVFNANNTPLMSSGPGDQPVAADFPATFGLETRVTNRGLRFKESLAADASVSAADFEAIKYDKRYSKDSALAQLVARLAARDLSKEPDAATLGAAQAVLRGWDLGAGAKDRGTALAVLTGLPVVGRRLAGEPPVDELEALRGAIATLQRHHGRLDPEWGEVSRFRRGAIDAPTDGGPDVLRDFEAGMATDEDGRFIAAKGDTLYFFVEWDREGRLSARGIHQFGSATLDAASPHYADQSPLFLAERTKPVRLDEADLRRVVQREYRPGRPAAASRR